MGRSFVDDVYLSPVRKQCPHCEFTIGIAQEMCAGCERRRAQEAAGGITRLERYLASWAAFKLAYPDPD